jgi:phosphohistidine phosphatase
VVDLYLVRHAIAEKRNAALAPDDSKRPLTSRGEALFRRAARGLREIGVVVDVTLASPYARAWRTAELLVEEAQWPEPIACPQLEPGTSPTECLAALLERTEWSVAVIGHEPLLSRVASLVATGDPDSLALDLKKGSVTCLRLDGGRAPGSGVLRWSASPKLLRRVRAAG